MDIMKCSFIINHVIILDDIVLNFSRKHLELLRCHVHIQLSQNRLYYLIISQLVVSQHHLLFRHFLLLLILHFRLYNIFRLRLQLDIFVYLVASRSVLIIILRYRWITITFTFSLNKTKSWSMKWLMNVTLSFSVERSLEDLNESIPM